MKMTKRLVLAGLTLSLAMLAGAQSLNKMVITKLDGSPEHTALIDPGTKITFSGENMAVTLPDASVIDIPLASVEKIRFDLSSGVDDISTTDLGDVTINVNHKVVTISANGNKVRYAAFSMAGTLVAAGATDTYVSVDFAGLQPGVYIIKANDKVIKFLNK